MGCKYDVIFVMEVKAHFIYIAHFIRSNCFFFFLDNQKRSNFKKKIKKREKAHNFSMAIQYSLLKATENVLRLLLKK